MNLETEIRNKLFALSDKNYKEFNLKIVRTEKSENMIGVRMPIIKNLAKEIIRNGQSAQYFTFKHKYYEEIMLHGFLLSSIKNKDDFLFQTERFLPMINNWSICDSTVASIKNVNFFKDDYKGKCMEWLRSEREFTARFAIVSFTNYYLGNDYDETISKELSKIESDKYYVNVAVAWYFATALSKQPEHTLPYFENGEITNSKIHNKAIQKAMESFAISAELKTYLKGLKKQNNRVTK